MAATLQDYVGVVTLSDGAWGTELDRRGCPPGYCREEWNIAQPALVAEVPAAYIAAGAQIVLTNTFGANRITLEKHGFGQRAREFNRAGAQISKAAAGDRAKVFGSIGPTGKMVLMGEVTEQELLDVFREQAEGLAEGGADALVVETMSELAEASAAIQAAKSTGLLTVACMSYDSGKDKTCTMMGVNAKEATAGMLAAGADIIGCNCGTGIDGYVKITAMLRSATDRPIWVKPNAGLPEIIDGKVCYRVPPEEFAEKAKLLVQAGANIVGGCCGSGPEFIAALRDALGTKS